MKRRGTPWARRPRGVAEPVSTLPRMRTRALILTLVLALAPASAALAQGAGDEQYADPFGEVPEENGGGGAGGGGGGEPAPDPGVPADDGSGDTAGSDAPELESSPTPDTGAGDSGSAAELPRTGLDVATIFAMGLGLLAMGWLLLVALVRTARPSILNRGPTHFGLHNAPRGPRFARSRGRRLTRR